MCLCNDTVPANLDLVCSEDYTCTTLPGGVCYTKKYKEVETGATETRYSCLERDENGLQSLFCSGTFNTETVNFMCCDNSDLCNADTLQSVISPQPTPSATNPGKYIHILGQQSMIQHSI